MRCFCFFFFCKARNELAESRQKSLGVRSEVDLVDHIEDDEELVGDRLRGSRNADSVLIMSMLSDSLQQKINGPLTRMLEALRFVVGDERMITLFHSTSRSGQLPPMAKMWERLLKVLEKERSLIGSIDINAMSAWSPKNIEAFFTLSFSLPEKAGGLSLLDILPPHKRHLSVDNVFSAFKMVLSIWAACINKELFDLFLTVSLAMDKVRHPALLPAAVLKALNDVLSNVVVLADDRMSHTSTTRLVRDFILNTAQKEFARDVALYNRDMLDSATAGSLTAAPPQSSDRGRVQERSGNVDRAPFEERSRSRDQQPRDNRRDDRNDQRSGFSRGDQYHGQSRSSTYQPKAKDLSKLGGMCHKWVLDRFCRLDCVDGKGNRLDHGQVWSSFSREKKNEIKEFAKSTFGSKV